MTEPTTTTEETRERRSLACGHAECVTGLECTREEQATTSPWVDPQSLLDPLLDECTLEELRPLAQRLQAALGAARKELASVRAELTTTANQVQHYINRNAEAVTREDATRRRFEAFKERVRTVAIRESEEHGWCGVVDEALEELGLERRERPYEVSFDVTVTVVRQVTATSDDNAENLARNALTNAYLREGVDLQLVVGDESTSGEISDISLNEARETDS